MGLSGAYVWADGVWVEPAAPGAATLAVDVHDSDLAVVQFDSVRGVSGYLQLGVTLEAYFGPDMAEAIHEMFAPEPYDEAVHTSRFVQWAAQVHSVDIAEDDVRPLLADPAGELSGEPFVEVTVGRLLALVGLTLPSQGLV